jgi:two-component system, chemotaxis family, chemotaxis protein CheY
MLAQASRALDGYWREMADIIVIDDDPGYRRLIAHALAGAGHTVRQAGDGAEGLAMCLERTPQLVITDIVMPGMEGIETILQLARQRPQVAVLAISGAEPGSVYLRAATALGAAAALSKPFTIDQLLTTVAGLLATDRKVPVPSV